MTIARREISSTAPEPGEAVHARLLPQLGMLLRALLVSPVGKTLILLAVGLLLVIIASAYGQIRPQPLE